MVLWYHYLLCISTRLHLCVLVVCESWAWSGLHRSILSSGYYSIYCWRSYAVKVISVTLDRNHFTVWVFYIWGSYMHFLMNIVLLSWILVGKSTTSCLEESFLVYRINYVFHELTWLIRNIFIWNLLRLMILYFHCTVRIMKLLV